MTTASKKPLLVIGAGISGITAALEAAEVGQEVILVEKEPTVGGRVARIYNYFPKFCPPACGMEINTRRLDKNPRIRLLTDTTVKSAKEAGGSWTVEIERKPLLVNDRCTVCGDCSKVCPSKIPDPFNLGMVEVPAIRLYNQEAFPRRFTLDRAACADDCKVCVDACKYDAIDLAAKGTTETLEVSAVVVGTGWTPYPKDKLVELGAIDHKNVIANVELERMASPSGPTQGKILLPSTGEPPKTVAFAQCAGSRDKDHLAYCSGVCCLASFKQAHYVKEQLPDAEVTIYYIDRRAPGRNEEVLTKAAALEGVKLVKGKLGKITDAGDGQVKLRVEDIEADQLVEPTVDMLVLATGMMSNLRDGALPIELELDDDGFGLDAADKGLFVAGVARRPEDVAATVRDATGAAAKAFASAMRSV